MRLIEGDEAYLRLGGGYRSGLEKLQLPLPTVPCRRYPLRPYERSLLEARRYFGSFERLRGWLST